MVKSRKAKLFRRTSKNLPEQKIIGIFCEGASELQYFKMLQRKYGKSNVGAHKLNIKQLKGKKGISIVTSATAQRNSIPDLDEVYVVFDCDNLTKNDIQQSMSMAKKKNIQIIFSNINFEIWILMHFEPVSRIFTKKELNRKLADNKHFNLGKNTYDHFKGSEYGPFLEDKVKIAVANGKSLYRSNNDMVNSQPYTNVQEFIKPIFGRED
ncbi:hypothetical protein C5L30_001830 [Companilactobacillus farciminis]|uniref:RloB-like protein n=1 Tax=Companilactobacillus farciminis TaxID=1612 RepID=A0A4R5NK72_9LACO|nr:RloB family protein [Companilactobacillus farciminis]TDG75043.1 hypothetical protein C5L30_001830 [Companilactobacillus farciminis]